MAITLPFPVRVAAGILATGIDVVRSLPEDIPAIPVTLVGNAMKLSMKVQQEIATLATRGDELLGGVIGAPQESPAWATFDDDEPAAPTPATGVKPRLKSAPTGDQVDATAGAEKQAGATKPKSSMTSTSAGSATRKHNADNARPADTATTATSTPDGSADDLTTPTESSVAPVTTIAMDAALDVPESVIDLVIGIDSEVSTAQPDLAATGTGSTVASTNGSPNETGGPDDKPGWTEAAEPDGAPAAEADGPSALPGYDRMTLAQVRGHLRELTPDEVSALLRYEQDGNNRAPFLTLLSNRLVTLDAQNS